MAAGEKIEKYKQLLINLLPKGRLWEPTEQPTLKAIIDAAATELCRVDDRIETFLDIETDPRKTDELLPEWERLLGLPDECTPDGITEDERREQVVEKYTNVGGLSADFYEAVIANLGITASVVNPLPFQVGRATVGQRLTNDFYTPFVAGSQVGQRLALYGWMFCFEVYMPLAAATTETFEVGEPIGNPLKVVSNPLVECIIQKLKPAHAGVKFYYE